MKLTQGGAKLVLKMYVLIITIEVREIVSILYLHKLESSLVLRMLPPVFNLISVLCAYKYMKRVCVYKQCNSLTYQKEIILMDCLSMMFI